MHLSTVSSDIYYDHKITLIKNYLYFLETKTVSVNEDAYFFPDYSTQNQIPRANVAKFMLEALEKEFIY